MFIFFKIKHQNDPLIEIEHYLMQLKNLFVLIETVERLLQMLYS